MASETTPTQSEEIQRLVIEAARKPERSTDLSKVQATALRLLAAGVSRRETAGLLSELFDIPRNDAYQLVVAVRGET